MRPTQLIGKISNVFLKVRSDSASSCFCKWASFIPQTTLSLSMSSKVSANVQCSDNWRSSTTNSAIVSPSLLGSGIKK